MKYTSEEIGKLIKDERTKKKWSQEKLGAKLGISGKQVSNYEKGVLTPPVDILFNLCEIFDCELGYLLGEEGYSSGTKLETAIEGKTNLSKGTIAAICHITGSDHDCVNWGYEAKSYRRIMNKLLSSSSFCQLVENIYDLDNEINRVASLNSELEGKYDKETLSKAYEYYSSTTDYIYDENAPKLPDVYYEIFSAIDSVIDKQHDASYSIKVLRYEVREAFERLLDNMYPQ